MSNLSTAVLPSNLYPLNWFTNVKLFFIVELLTVCPTKLATPSLPSALALLKQFIIEDLFTYPTNPPTSLFPIAFPLE